MKRMTFDVPFWNFTVTLVKVEGPDDAEGIKGILRAFGVAPEDFDDVVSAVERVAFNGGDTFREMRQKKMLVIFYPMDSDFKRAEIYSHEKRHVEDRLLEWQSVNDIESAGMLAGFLGGQFHLFERL